MVRFLGIFLLENLIISRALLLFYGMGIFRIRQILNFARVSPHKLVKSLNIWEISKLRLILSRCFLLEGDLKRLKEASLKRHTDIGSAAGRRHWVGLPARGQRTRTNARTRKESRNVKYSKI